MSDMSQPLSEAKENTRRAEIVARWHRVWKDNRFSLARPMAEEALRALGEPVPQG